MSTQNTGIAAQIQAIKQADKRRKAVLRMVNKGMSFAEIGEALTPPVSRQRAQQIYKKATREG
jgi:DNA-binding NarL/FixJ family response regulator